MNGFTAVPNELFDSPVFANPKLWKVLTWILRRANYENRDVLHGRQTVHLRRGQFIFGRQSAADSLGMAASTTWDCVKALEKLGYISIKSNNKFSVVTVEIPMLFEQDNDESRQQINSSSTTNRHRIEKKKIRNNFTKPSVSEISSYCEERKNSINPESFFDFYEARGWMLGKSKMKDWKAAVRTWERNSKGGSENKAAAEPDYYV